jgi:NitT/TauT family transport system permease protein
VKRWAAVAAGALAILLLWSVIVVLFDYPPFILPGPLVVGQRFGQAVADGTFWPHLLTTIVEILLGLAVGGAIGLLVGYALARSRLVGAVLSPYIVAAQSTPILALAPLIALWFGTGLLSRVVICALIVFFPIAVSTMVGFRTVDPQLLEMGRSLRATARQLLWTIEVPAALPQILGGFRIGVTLAIVGAIVAEWAGGERGLGVLINLARGSLFDIPLLFATLLLIAVVGIVMYALVVAIERRILGPRDWGART